MTFEFERCSHGIPYTVPCPECVLQAMARITMDHDMLTDEVPPLKPEKPADEADPE